MTMEIEVKNKSENYVGKVREIDHYENNRPSDGGEYILNPGESKLFYISESRSIRVREFEEISRLPEDEKPDSPDNEDRSGDFRNELSALLNKHSKENGSNTPDFILAEYLDDCLLAYDNASEHRDRWHMKEKPA